MDKRYLERRRQRWYLVVDVPRGLREHVGKKRVLKSLGTASLKEAQRLRWEVLAEIKKYFALIEDQAARGEFLSEPERVIVDAKAFAAELQIGAERAGEGATEAYLEGLDQWMEQHLNPFVHARKTGKLPPVDPETGYRTDLDPAYAEALRVARRTVMGEVGVLVKDALQSHLEGLRKRNRRESTIEARETKVMAFLNWRGKETELADVSMQDVGRYRTEVLLKSGRALKTIKGDASHLKAFGEWSVDSGYIDSNPFERITKQLEDTSRGAKEKREAQRRPWEADELVTLLNGIVEHRRLRDPLWALTVIALYTGMRAEEVAASKTSDVHIDTKTPYVHIPEGKTENSIRDVPLHPLIVPLVKHLVNRSRDEYLIEKLKRGGQDNKRFHGQSKRFRTLTRGALGITDTRLTFHSFRHNFSTAMRRAGLDSDTSSQITGHAKQGVGAFKTYDHGLLLQQLAKAVAKVGYGKEVTDVVGQAIKELTKDD